MPRALPGDGAIVSLCAFSTLDDDQVQPQKVGHRMMAMAGFDRPCATMPDAGPSADQAGTG